MKRIGLLSCLLIVLGALGSGCEDSKNDDKAKDKTGESKSKTEAGKSGGLLPKVSGSANGAPVAAKVTPGSPATKVAAGAPAAGANGWSTYTNKQYGFTVETRRQPRMGRQTVPTEAGTVTAKTFTFSRPGANGMIAIWVTPMPFPKGHKPDPNQMFDGAVTNALRVIGGKVSNQKNLTVAGVPGREVEASGQMKGRRVGAFFRMFYQGRTLYQVMSIYLDSEKAMIAEAKRLIRSFKPVAGGAPKLPSGTAAVEIGDVKVSPKKMSFGPKKGGYYLAVTFSVNAKKPLAARDRIRVHTWCNVPSGLKAVSSYARSSDVKKISGGGKVNTRTAPFILKPLPLRPKMCQMSFRIRQGMDDKAELGDWCYDNGKVAKGTCSK
jgi:hypothetical protein